ncbi:putative PEP-CTERM system TPR-repeat lipoprotein [Luteitalea pratensis]|uniref:Putative PEP-CTERM system TPR-repeat lipoprotein n=1 Tax=Luteitalea pratensis TaxID=1855912 RepID=A0A143PUE1_LUTPR|nr:retroviral-like aspartic protease family protein [Luteitalea pratensis]AMY11424.1 putative PEP-CTERM system TPR-repeat lipoprotein [Luteitalea pratensis]
MSRLVHPLFTLRPRLLAGIAAASAAVAMATVVPQAGTPLTAQAEFTRGTQLFADAKYREAVQALVRAREYDPELKTQVTRLVVRSLLRVGDFGRAEQEASSLVTSSVGTEDLSLHAETLWSTGHFEEAHARYTTALTLDARYPAALHGIARVLDARGKTADALVAVERAIEGDPEVAEYHHTRAYLLERLGHYDVAADELERYLRLLPEKGFKDQIRLARARMKFLRHFGERTPLSMGEDVVTQVHVIPFREEREKLFVKARINGRINTDLVLDTGAEMTVLSEDAAQRAQVYSVAETLSAGVGDVGLRRLKLARINKLEIGTLTIEHVPTMIKDPPLKKFPTADIDAFSPLAVGLSMRVDYEKKQVIVARTLPKAEGTATMEAPLWMHRLATVRGRLNGDRPAAFVIDTGGQAISISRTAAIGLEQLGRFRRIPLKVYGSSGWDRDAFLLPGVDLEVDDVRMAQTSLVVLNLRAPSVLLGYELGGILGHKFLSKYRVSLDIDEGLMRLDD